MLESTSGQDIPNWSHEGVVPGDHNLSATALAYGNTRDSKFVSSTPSPHMSTSPMRITQNSNGCKAVMVNHVCSCNDVQKTCFDTFACV